MKYLLFFFCCSVSLAAMSQNDNVTYHQDRQIAELMDVYKMYNKKNDFGEGYRIQISFSNDRQEAYNTKAKIYKDLPGDKCYVEYEEPYYKVKVGDFATRLDAYDELRSVIAKYPGAFVVRSKVKIK